MATLNSTANGSGGGFLHTNPIISRLNKLDFQDDAEHCTYAGITRKLAYFAAMILVGIVINAVIRFAGGGAVQTGGEITGGQMAALAVSGLIFLVTPFLCSFVISAIPVAGSLYCVATGYLVSFLATAFGGQYSGPIVLALLITLVLVLMMGFLLFNNIVKVSQKFSTIMMIIFGTVVLSGLLVFIAGLIPATRPFVLSLGANRVLSIGGGILMVILGTMFLLVDFNAIRNAVDQQLPKQYEWYASYGLVFSVIWLYFKILQIILSVTKRSN